MDTAEQPPLMRWTTERFLALVESGIIHEGRGVELVDGQVVTEMPQGELHLIALRVLQRALAASGGFEFGMMVAPTLVLAGDNSFDPEIAFLSSAEYDGLPRGKDVRFVIEVSDSSRAYDLGRKRDVYAAAGIPHYWVVDVVKRGIWDFSRPVDGLYALTRFVATGETIEIPLLEKPLSVESLFMAPKP